MKKNGIYGYWDNKEKYVNYIGKDSNITINKRHNRHYHKNAYNEQQINRVLQNDKNNRYDYFVLCEGYFTDDELRQLEEEAIAIFKTYYYDYPDKKVYNYTRGGEEVFNKKYTLEERIKKSKSNNKTGFYGVRKAYAPRAQRNFLWRYEVHNDGKRYVFDSVLLKDLKDKVLDNNFTWYVVDEEKANKSLLEDEIYIQNTPRYQDKYWDKKCVIYDKNKYHNIKNTPKKCFALRYNNKKLSLGMMFLDFTSVEIINDLIKEAI